MLISNFKLVESTEIQKNIFLQKIYAPEIAQTSSPGQFLNIRVTDTHYPLLRRPFSICNVDDDHIYLMYSIYGEGTKLLSHKNIGDEIDILGPLGNGFDLNDDYDTAVIVAGGIGAAPFPFLTSQLPSSKKVITFIGGRTNTDIIPYGMKNIFTSTDDGSDGFKGNIVELFKLKFEDFNSGKVKVFGCGPTPMLKSLQKFCLEHNINCEISTECAMACGFGICQGCPIESTKENDSYLLVCKDGPVFNAKDVVL